MPAGSITAGPKSVTRAMDATSLLRLLSSAIPSTWLYLFYMSNVTDTHKFIELIVTESSMQMDNVILMNSNSSNGSGGGSTSTVSPKVESAELPTCEN